jgi:hypothetical protein
MRVMNVGWALFAAAALAVLTSCGGGTTGDTSQSSTSGAASATGNGKTTAGAGASKVNMEEIFPAGAGRDLVLNNCQNCHTFVPIVVLQMDEEAWTRSSLDHRQRVNVSDDEFMKIYTYLKANFNPNRPVPKLPKELLESWTTY